MGSTGSTLSGKLFKCSVVVFKVPTNERIDDPYKFGWDFVPLNRAERVTAVRSFALYSRVSAGALAHLS